MSFRDDDDDEWGRAKRDCYDSDMDSISSFQSVDEGAISILSIDQIRNMKQKLQANCEIEVDKDATPDDDEENEERGFVKPLN